MKVLLVNLPDKISRYILLVLRVRWPGVTPIHAEEDEEAVGLLHAQQPDLAILHLPERGDGSAPEDCFGLIDRIREFSEVPLIVVGETDDVMDKVKALETGADDWVSTSFVPMEFIAKVNAIMRRCHHDEVVSSLLDGRLSIDHATRHVYVSGNPVKLTPIQFEILNHLVKNAGRVCTSSELLQRVWGPGYGDDKEILKLSVHRLRSKIEKDPSAPEIILNERGIGYTIRATNSGR